MTIENNANLSFSIPLLYQIPPLLNKERGWGEVVFKSTPLIPLLHKEGRTAYVEARPSETIDFLAYADFLDKQRPKTIKKRRADVYSGASLIVVRVIRISWS